MSCGKKHRAIVSVPFSVDEFTRVCESAERAGAKISAYIRDAALAALKPKRQPIVMSPTSNSCMITYLEVWQEIP